MGFGEETNFITENSERELRRTTQENRVAKLHERFKPMRLLNATFVVVGGYHQMVRRSFGTEITNDAIENLLESTKGGRNFSAFSLASVGSEIIRPQADYEGYQEISEGWEAPRMRFVLEFTKEGNNFGVVNKFTYVGYTDYVGANVSGDIDHELKMFVTAVIHTKHTPTVRRGGYGEDTQLVSFEQILTRDVGARRASTSGMEYSLTPCDVYSYTQMNSAFGDEGDIVYGSSAVGKPRFSARTNLVSSSYLTRLLKSAQVSEMNQLDDYSIGTESIYDTVVETSAENQIARDPLFSLMGRSSDIYNGALVHWGEIISEFPEADYGDITTVIFPEVVRADRGLDNALDDFCESRSEETSEWTSYGQETIIATMVSQQLPSIMMSELIASMRFTCTNDSRNFMEDGYTWMWGDPRRRNDDNAINFVVGGLGDEVGHQLIQNFMQKFEMLIMQPMSQYGELKLSITCDITAIGDSMIAISLDNGEERRFIYPVHADNKTSPIITADGKHFNTFCSDMYNLTRQVGL